MNRLNDRIDYYSTHSPEHTAFTFRVGEHYETIDYKTLCEYMDSLSGFLAEYENKTVAIIGNNKLEYAVSLLTVLCRIGDVFLIDKELGEEDIRKLFLQKAPDIIIADEKLGFFPEGFSILTFREISRIIKEKREGCPALSCGGNLILHTSGTTGEPKCVSLSEENYFGVIPELNKKWQVTAEQSCLFIIPLYHIYALTSLFHGLYAGINNILEWDYKRLGQVLRETKPHLFMGVPLMYNRIKDAVVEKAGSKIRAAIALSNLLMELGIDIRRKMFREIYAYFGGNYVFGVSAGSLIPYETSRFFNDIGLPIYNVYGMTETSGPIAINYKGHNLFDSVGEILDINEVTIQDPDADGVGRICVKGSNVFDGYLGDGKGVAGEQFFDTGDLGYIRDRYLYVTGRRKNVLIGDNGKNISPEELNRKLLQNNRIHDCNVIMEDNRLVALVNTELDEKELGQYIEKINTKLPRYKRISGWRITVGKIK